MPDETPHPAATDAFWAPVRRRHPDIDLVLLPEQAAPDETSDPAELPAPLDTNTIGAVAREAEEQVAALWAHAVGSVTPSEQQRRWASGRTSGSVRRESSWVAEEVPPEQGIAALRRAAESLERDGWHVLAPPDGLPRLTAGRDEGLDRAEVLLLVVPESGRLVLRWRTGAHPVDAALRHELEAGEQA